MKNFTALVDLAAERLGGRVLLVNDEFFAPKENLLKEEKPVFIEGKYTTHGKWMDGWETRRRRTPGYDWAIIKLGVPGIVRGLVVDTSFFTGNFPPRCSVEGCCLPGSQSLIAEKKLLSAAGMPWTQVLPESLLNGDSQNLFEIVNPGHFTHLRLNIFPDGGIARLRVHGEVAPEPAALNGENGGHRLDLCSILNGGSIVGSSDQFYGNPLNMLFPGNSRNMGDGWETRRRRGPGYDWAIVKLGVPGYIEEIEVDTSHYKGNYPESCSIDACFVDPAQPDSSPEHGHPWKLLLARTKLKAHHHHIFCREIEGAGLVSHIRLNIYPDGGIARLRIYGRNESNATPSSAVEKFNRLKSSEARKVLIDCCGSPKWVERMIDRKPFASVDALLQAASILWNDLAPKDWMEAFLHHPVIGQKRAEVVQSQAARRWSSGEQFIADEASADAKAELAAANREYRQKFGHIFLICASGKTTDEILTNLRSRLPNDPETELRIAAGEQRKITELRLKKFLAS